MGGTSCKSTSSGNKVITIAILGLDNAGKTTTARVLEKESVDTVAPTIGYSQSEIVHKNEKIKLIDLGGAKGFRDSWRHYYDDAYGFVYVLDSSEESRLGENRDVLKRLLQEEKVKGKPLLILANKQDKADALDKNAILEDLKIERLANENQTLCRVELCTAKGLSRSGRSAAKVDDAIRHGFDWLIKVIYENHEALHKRVEKDVQARDAAQQKEKRERQERVKKAREEREKEEGKPEEDDEEDTVKNGFVPINQAVKNADRNLPDKTSQGKVKNGHASDRPIPAPRSSSQNRKLVLEETKDDAERPRRYSSDTSPRQQASPMSQSHSSRFDDDDQINSNEERTTLRTTTAGKKKKLLGPIRHRDNLPPLAPSSAASRREDFTMSKGPPVSTPRPTGPVAQWAITSHTPVGTAEKLTSIVSDNELDVDDDHKHRSSKPAGRIVSPHPTVTNRINRPEDDDENKDRKPTAPKPRTRRLGVENKDEDESEDSRKNANVKERDQFSSRRFNPPNAEDDDDDEDDAPSSRRTTSSARRTVGAGDSSSRSHSRTKKNLDDDLR